MNYSSIKKGRMFDKSRRTLLSLSFEASSCSNSLILRSISSWRLSNLSSGKNANHVNEHNSRIYWLKASNTGSRLAMPAVYQAWIFPPLTRALHPKAPVLLLFVLFDMRRTVSVIPRMIGLGHIQRTAGPNEKSFGYYQSLGLNGGHLLYWALCI